MGASIGCLGQVVFQVSSKQVETFDNFKRMSRAVYADHETVVGKQSSEFTGLDLDDITFTMRLNATLGVSPTQEVETLREMKDSGQAHMLVIGSRLYGYFTIRQVGDAILHTLLGDPMVTDVEIILREYEDKQQGGGAEAAGRDAANRGVTGKGGPAKVPCARAPIQTRELTPSR